MSIVADPSISGDPSNAELFAAGWRALAFAGTVAVLAVLLLRASPIRWAPIVALGAALYLAPPVLLSVAGKYQVELDTSRAYLPVLMQVFGMAVLGTAMLAALLRLAQARSRLMVVSLVVGVALFAGLTGGVTAFNNIRVVGIIQPDRASRELVEASAEHGAFAAIPPSSSVFFSDRDLAWQGPTPYQGYMYIPLMLSDKTGHVLDARLIPDAGPGACATVDLPVQPACAPPSERGATWTRVRVRRDGGTVVVARLASPTPREFASAAAERSLTVYRETDDGGTPEPPRLIGRTQKAQPWTSDGGSWTVKREGDGWRIWELTLPRGPAPVASTLDDDHGYVDFLGLPAPAARAHMMGTRRLLP
jgi:hypothetical protein